MVYRDRPWWIKVHGLAGIRFLDLVNAGRKPSGRDFPETVRDLCVRAGVPFPERPLTPEEAEALRKRDLRRGVLDAVRALAERHLWSPGGEAARAYLATRGFDDDDMHDLGLGLFPPIGDVRCELATTGHDLAVAEEAGVLWKKFEGYVLIPWADAQGWALTLYGRWPEKEPPEGRPKTIALPGEGTKGSPLYFDRARQAGHRDLVGVEGVFDAALLQRRGDSRVVAYVAAQFSGLQVETLVRYGVRSVTICPDPDGGGDKGGLSSIRSLRAHGIGAYVAPRLPDDLDPDEFVLRDGIDVWKEHVGGAVAAATHEALLVLDGVSPDSPDPIRRGAITGILDLLDTLGPPTRELDLEDVLRLTEERTGHAGDTLRRLHDQRRGDADARGRGSGGMAGGGASSQNDSAAPRGAEAAESKLRFRTAPEIAAATPPQVDWAAKPWAAFGALTEVAGKIKSAGKTTFVSQMVRQVLDGRPFMGQPTSKTPVLWLTEQADSSFREALRRADLLERKDLTILSWGDTVGTEWARVVAEAVAEAERRGVRLIVVDTLPQFAGLRGDAENNAGDALAALRPLQVAAAKGLAIIVVRHDRKSGGEVGDSGRGSSAFGGGVDIVLSLRRPDGRPRPTIRRLEALSRYDETRSELVIELTDKGYVALGAAAAFAEREARARVMAVALKEAGAAETVDEFVNQTALGRTTIQKVLKELWDTGHLRRTGTGKRGHPYRYRPDRPAGASRKVSAGTGFHRAAERNGTSPWHHDPSQIVEGEP
jgi:hypothetical protein